MVTFHQQVFMVIIQENGYDETRTLIQLIERKVKKKSEIQHLELYKLYNIPIHIFRLPGIYGPERSIFERLQLGENSNCQKGHFFQEYMLRI